jgi:L-lactate dehydrogenase complex protein LldF
VKTDGPEEMIVILLDNGRTNILADERQRESLYCIRCGACLNACPIYKNIGGHAYGVTYSGPIGSVITPHLQGLDEYKHLSYASSLCGNCTSVCAVKINLHELLLENRYQSVREKKNDWKEKMAWQGWKQAMLFRPSLNMASGKMKNWFVNKVFKSWTVQRGPLQFPDRTFNQRWRDKYGDT